MATNTTWTFRPVNENQEAFLDIKEWAEAHSLSMSEVFNVLIIPLRDALYNTTHYDKNNLKIKTVLDFGVVEFKVNPLRSK